MRRKTAQQWQDLVRQQIQSESSVRAFCAQQGLSVSNFYRHKALLSQQPAQRSTEQPSRFIALKVPESVPSHSLGIDVHYGEVFLKLSATTEPVWLAQLLKELR